MRVLVTGATGFVGSHIAAELAREGHQVKLLVRNPAAAHAALKTLGAGQFEAALADVGDPKAVERGLEGCEAVVHSAAVFSLDARMDAEVRRVNVHGTETVLAAAHRFGLDPIVYVSTIGALLGTRGALLGPDSPPTWPPGAYFRSKAEADRVARGYQALGAPVVITYPPIVWGPYDPACGESCREVIGMLRGLWTVAFPGGFPLSDVRDVAKLHRSVLEAGRGPRRYMAAARNLSLRDILGSASRVTGRRLPSLSLPAWLFGPPARLLDLAQRFLPFRLPLDYQSIYVTALHPRVDDQATRREFGIEPRELDDTIADTVRWLVGSGRLAPRLAGRLAAQDRPEERPG